MHLCMFLSPVDALPKGSAIFGLVLVSAALIGVGRRGGFSYHIYPDGSITVGIFPIGIFSFTRCFVQNLGLSEKSLRTPLRT